MNMQPTAVPAVVEDAIDAIRPTAAAKSIIIDQELAPCGELLADPDRLQQVMWNLLTNAMKFTPTGGRVRVQTQRLDDLVCIRVTDNGAGIRPEFLPYVFDQFRQAESASTRRQEGLGLGLAIVRNIVELHGGRVWVESEGEGRGATFTVELPAPEAADADGEADAQRDRSQAPALTAASPVAPVGAEHAAKGNGSPAPSAAEPAPAAAANDGKPAARLDGVHVLVVEDSPDARTVLRYLLRRCGAEVETADSAQDAMQHLERQLPDVLISDLCMPNEDGMDFIRRVRALPADRGGSVPALALTACVREDLRRRVLAAGFQAYADKPTRPETLASLILDAMKIAENGNGAGGQGK